ncbi:unknown [Clostridium sp. CAG:389]|nr:unknown [Clostridium sp. CAG:389]
MNLKKFFPRRKTTNVTPQKEDMDDFDENVIIFNDPQIKELVTKWTKSGGWKCDDFVYMVKYIGLKAPIVLTDLNTEKETFKCLTADKKEVTMLLKSCKKESVIEVREEGETRRYFIGDNSKEKIVLPLPKLQTIHRTKNGKRLIYNYLYNHGIICHCVLIVDEKHMLEVSIVGENTYKGFVNDEKVQKYIEELDDSLTITQVYEDVMNLFELTKEDISKCSSISFCYNEGDVRRSEICKVRDNSQMYYEIIENEKEWIRVLENGDWQYWVDNINLIYKKATDNYVLNTSGKEAIINCECSKILEHVEEMIQRMKR